MSQNRPMMPQKRPKIRTPPHRGCGVLLRRLHTSSSGGHMSRMRALFTLLVVAFALSTVAADREPFLRQHFGAAVPAEPRLADPLLQVEICPDVGRHVGQPVLAALPPASERHVITSIRCTVHQLYYRVSDAVLRVAAAEHLH